MSATAPHASSHGRSDRMRCRKSPLMRWNISKPDQRIMEAVFAKTRYPSSEMLNMLARQMGVTLQQVKVWFRNRRQRVRLDGAIVETLPPALTDSVQCWPKAPPPPDVHHGFSRPCGSLSPHVPNAPTAACNFSCHVFGSCTCHSVGINTPHAAHGAFGVRSVAMGAGSISSIPFVSSVGPVLGPLALPSANGAMFNGIPSTQQPNWVPSMPVPKLARIDEVSKMASMREQQSPPPSDHEYTPPASQHEHVVTDVDVSDDSEVIAATSLVKLSAMREEAEDAVNHSRLSYLSQMQGAGRQRGPSAHISTRQDLAAHDGTPGSPDSALF